MYPIYFIESLDNPNGFYRAVEEEIQKLPSNYITHDTFTVAANEKAWTVTGLLLKNVDVLEDTTSLEQARKKEGVFNFGSGPNLNDGKPRILFSLLRREQLHYNPGYTYWDTQKTILGIRCVHVGDSRIPLEYAVSQMSLPKYRKSSKPKKAVKSENPIFLSLQSIVTAGASVADFLQLKLYQNEAFICRCQETFDATYVKVALEEHTWCKVLSKVGFKVQEEVREITLRDKEIYFTFKKSGFKTDGSRFSININDEVFNCELPNIGPSFISDDCARTYTLRIELTFYCTTGKCSSTLSTSINLDVAIENHVSTFKPLKQPQRKQTLLFFDKIPMTPNIVSDVASSTALRTTNVPQCLGLDLDKFLTLKVTVPENQTLKLIGLRVKLLQKKIRVLPGGLHDVKNKWFKLKRNTSQSSFYKTGTTKIDGSRYRCKIPNVEPSILSNGLLITYRLFVFLKFQKKNKTVFLGNGINLDMMTNETSCLVSPPSYSEG
ncbi:uncharacterized protein CXQ87_004597 [Candidozyma duobushaemuli]|uniref:Uncharacterized protein n=1 Tax=Candidozyma duobushaemuli TaxID=1231522 RepID=A0A2V1AGI1_9ASCO|nr:uncharacterized protein CXQ87_004597 [[Candida] duobushaemulonis]PVH17038.1 hypothetical protein CXQ87_004597 [[Candida] duobushaemulonis]